MNKIVVDYSKRILLSIISILIFLILAELSLRIIYANNSSYNIEMWKYTSRLKQISHDSEIGHEHVPNHSEDLYNVEIRTNSIGVRSDREYLIPKPDGIKRILVLGDSITMGWGVEYKDTYSQLLELYLNEKTEYEVEVINAGVGNYNSQNELGTLKKLMALKPDMIILGFYLNDIEVHHYPKPIVLQVTKNSYFYAFLRDKLINMKSEKKYYKKYYLDLYSNVENKVSMNNAIAEMISLAQLESIPFVFLNIPEFHEFENYEFDSVNADIENELLKNQNLVYLNFLLYIQNQSILPEYLWVSSEDHHPNAIGHKFLANFIIESGIEDLW